LEGQNRGDSGGGPGADLAGVAEAEFSRPGIKAEHLAKGAAESRPAQLPDSDVLRRESEIVAVLDLAAADADDIPRAMEDDLVHTTTFLGARKGLGWFGAALEEGGLKDVMLFA
jgi:hypothetical protein